MHPIWPIALPPRDVDHVLIVVSDVEIGSGGPTDDFPQSGALAELLLSYLDTPPFSDRQLSFVFNGDTFDFLKTPTGDGSYPIHITEAAALEKLARVERAHGAFFDALRQLATRASVHFVVGNHDPELLFPAVQRRLSDLGPHVHHAGFGLEIGGVRIEHGHQQDPMFRMDESAPFATVGEDRVLNLPWGSLALLEVAVPLHPVFYPFDRVRPRSASLQYVPEVRELLLAKYWDYWTREFWKLRDADPLHRVSWTMLRQVAYRFSSRDPDVPELTPSKLRRPSSAVTLALTGHRHLPILWDQDEFRWVQTGCFRNEFRFDADDTRELLPSAYAEVFLQCGKVRRSRLVEVDMPPPPQVPGDLSRFAPIARALMPKEGSAKEQDAQEAHERRTRLRGLAPSGFVRTLADTLRRRIVS